MGQAGRVIPHTLVLLHSPLTTAAAWGALPDRLRDLGVPVAVVDVSTDGGAPYATRYVGAAALQLAAAPADPVVLVGHSGAGPLLPQVGFALRAARRVVGGYVFLDAGLPRAGRTASRLDLMDAEDESFAADLRAALEAGGRFPTWTEADLAQDVPDAGQRAALVASLRPRGLDFFTEPLPAPVDWPDAPCGVLRTSDGYEQSARLGRGRGWPVVSRDLGHFAGLAAPIETAEALVRLVGLL